MVTFFCSSVIPDQLPSLCISYNCVSTSPEVFIQQGCLRETEILEIRVNVLVMGPQEGAWGRPKCLRSMVLKVLQL